jgi:radical SAM superfamily enzyme YgiQ (UPF0313 family)
MTVCNKIIEKKLNEKLVFYVNTGSNTTDKEMLTIMKKAGIIEMSTGVESGNENILRKCQKGTKKHQYINVYNWMREIGLQTRGSFILGFPGETHKTVWDTINFARELNLMRVSCNVMTPYPGTQIYQQALKGEGIHFVDEDLDWKTFKRWGNSCIRTDQLTKKDLEYYQKLFLTLFYSQRKVIWYHIKQLFKGNFSYYFYRPLVFAVKNRVRMFFGRKIR